MSSQLMTLSGNQCIKCLPMVGLASGEMTLGVPGGKKILVARLITGAYNGILRDDIIKRILIFMHVKEQKRLFVLISPMFIEEKKHCRFRTAGDTAIKFINL